MTGPASGAPDRAAPDPATRDSATPRGGKRSVFALIADLPRLIVANLRAEYELLKAELTAKARKAITGAVLAVIALVLLFFGIGVLLDAAVWALSLVWPHWLAALVIGGSIILVVAILVLVAVAQFRSIRTAGRQMPGAAGAQKNDDAKNGALKKEAGA